jgi:hypothetical protein
MQNLQLKRPAKEQQLILCGQRELKHTVDDLDDLVGSRVRMRLHEVCRAKGTPSRNETLSCKLHAQRS